MKVSLALAVILAVACISVAVPPAPRTRTHAEEIAAGKHLILLNENDPPVWMTQTEVEALNGQELIHYIDITDNPEFPPVIRHPHKAGTFGKSHA